MKTLCAILSYNTPELTTNLYNSLEPYKSDIYDLIVIENGSNEFNSSLSRIELKRNIYFGGGLNYAFKYILANSNKYDSLMFLNSDLILHGMNYVKTLREYLNEYHIISPAIINSEYNQCHWKQMWNWNNNDIRKVKWIDFQAPLFHIDFIKKQQEFPNELLLGWGQDILSGINCEQWDMNIGVVDKCTITHLNSQTIRKNNHSPDPILQTYNQRAERAMFAYFQSDEGLMKKFTQFRNLGETYKND